MAPGEGWLAALLPLRLIWAESASARAESSSTTELLAWSWISRSRILSASTRCECCRVSSWVMTACWASSSCRSFSTTSGDAVPPLRPPLRWVWVWVCPPWLPLPSPFRARSSRSARIVCGTGERGFTIG